ncbi:hypothetical protein CHCC20488_0972 [Bacillus paralicheniformis]|uniref:Uncharacterized protein n=1 Tax=Bacillus paralicheniformis TaxID=1648923 RepID=A0ABY3FUG6_9BACI|nr:hypothetical protein LI7559_12955 [Bacillus licheniformis LMG 7559]TWJ36595.1 hypothetical protein CHCC5027_1338 [Bacillus paralicheniformis]TWJ57433.1 hypothetical protein CHCC5021_2180 [Bacillus paralicheniformis]TWJ81492.1 hypothetical protein CHCC20497_4579 [Bacillus paralicheniformis]TWK51874.1 hypothetical protein CHCC20347_3174 [Bacillus paralicheniformis]
MSSVSFFLLDIKKSENNDIDNLFICLTIKQKDEWRGFLKQKHRISTE